MNLRQLIEFKQYLKNDLTLVKQSNTKLLDEVSKKLQNEVESVSITNHHADDFM